LEYPQARLIAAAPNLLIAIERLMNTIRSEGIYVPPADRAVAEMAIDKARG